MDLASGISQPRGAYSRGPNNFQVHIRTWPNRTNGFIKIALRCHFILNLKSVKLVMHAMESGTTSNASIRLGV
jgi:hypothetical protein